MKTHIKVSDKSRITLLSGSKTKYNGPKIEHGENQNENEAEYIFVKLQYSGRNIKVYQFYFVRYEWHLSIDVCM